APGPPRGGGRGARPRAIPHASLPRLVPPAVHGAPMSDPERGLTSAEVELRVTRGDVNDVPATPTRTVASIVRANVFTRFNALLGAMLVIILFVGPFPDALFGILLVANTAIGIVQELRAKRTLDRLSVLTTPKV